MAGFQPVLTPNKNKEQNKVPNLPIGGIQFGVSGVVKTPSKKDVKQTKPSNNKQIDTKGFGYKIGGDFGDIAIERQRTNPLPSKPLGRVSTKQEDEALMGAAYDILDGASEDEILKLYPDVSNKLSPLVSFIYDAQDDTVEDMELFKAYPELSIPLKTYIRGSFIGDTTAEDIGNIQDGNVIKDVGEGLVSFAGGLPKMVAETGLLDRPAKRLAENVANPIRESMGKESLTEEEIGKFSEYAKGSQVGGDVNSKVAKTVTQVADIANVIGGIAGTKLIAKQLLKPKNIRKIISETENIKGKIGALEELGKKTKLEEQLKRAISLGDNIKVEQIKSQLKNIGGIEEQRSGILAKIWKGKNVVKPSKATQEATETIIKEIPNASTKPIKLFTQIVKTAENRSVELANKLKQIKVGAKLVDNKALIKDLNILAKDSSDTLGGTATTSIKRITKRLANLGGKSANDIRDIRKDLDSVISEPIKEGIGLSSREAMTRKYWLAARGRINNYLYSLDNGIKSEFKVLEDFYHATNQIEKNVDALTKNKLGALPKLYYGLKEALKYAVGGLVGAKIIQSTTGQ